MTLEDNVLMAKYHVRNFFNANNNPEEPPEPSAKYDLFLALCQEIHEFQERSGNTGIVSESVLSGAHSYTKAQNKDGSPVGWESVFRSAHTPNRSIMLLRLTMRT